MKLSVGQVVQDRYEVERILGAGGTALVYLVKERGTDQKYALKLLTVTSAAIRKRMETEGSAQKDKMNHPNVIRVTAVLDIDGAPALLMDFVDGPSLEQALQRYRLTTGDAETLFQGVLAGVSAAHAAGFVHRDLKPANVLLSRTRDGFVPKVADFGIAKEVAAIGDTRSGIAMGTPSYMSPEQIRDAASVDERADVWSLGCILYELLTRHRAFPGDEALAIYNAIVEGEFVPIRKLLPEVPARLEQAVHGCLRVELDDRIPDCDTLLAVILGAKEWPLPESTLTELARETPTIRTPLVEPPAPARRVEYHPGGAPDAGTGITAAGAPTALAPSMSPHPPGLGGGGAGLSVDAGLAFHGHDDEEAATVIVRTVDGTLVPHAPTPPSAPRATGWFVGGGLLALGLFALVGLSVVAAALLFVWVFVPPPGAVAVDVPPVPRTSPVPAAPEPPPAPAPAPRPPPTAPAPPPTAPAPRPPSPAPAPSRDPRPPVTADPTKQLPDSGVPDKVEVRIGTIPYGASVHVGNLQGAGPFKVALTPSRHPVIVSAPGYEPFSKLIAVSVEGTNTWCFDLIQRETLPQACP